MYPSASRVERKVSPEAAPPLRAAAAKDRSPLRAGPRSTEAQRDLPQSVRETLCAPGQPLDSATRAFMEPRFGCDFGQVRVHLDAAASESAAALDAKAYTVGTHIVLGAGQPAQESVAGQSLMAHELTHVVQQSRGGTLPELDASAAHEREAGAVANAVATGAPSVRVAAGTGIGVARESDNDRGVFEKFMRSQARFRAKATTFFASGIGLASHWVGLGPKPDWAGRAILERYLSGEGDWDIRNDDEWKRYMFASDHLRRIVRAKLASIVEPALGGGAATRTFVTRFHASTGVSSATPSGYGYLNGTNSDAGDFFMRGTYTVHAHPSGGWVVTANLNFEWNDKIDRNGWKDMPGDIVAFITSQGARSSYQISIHFDSSTRMRFDASGSLMYEEGYPAAVGFGEGGEFKGFPFPAEYQR